MAIIAYTKKAWVIFLHKFSYGIVLSLFLFIFLGPGPSTKIAQAAGVIQCFQLGKDSTKYLKEVGFAPHIPAFNTPNAIALFSVNPLHIRAGSNKSFADRIALRLKLPMGDSSDEVLWLNFSQSPNVSAQAGDHIPWTPFAWSKSGGLSAGGKLIVGGFQIKDEENQHALSSFIQLTSMVEAIRNEFVSGSPNDRQFSIHIMYELDRVANSLRLIFVDTNNGEAMDLNFQLPASHYVSSLNDSSYLPTNLISISSYIYEQSPANSENAFLGNFLNRLK